MGETQKTEQEWRDDLKQRFASISFGYTVEAPHA